MVDDHVGRSDASEPIDRFVSRYTNPKTAQQYRAELSALFALTGATHPRAFTDAAVNHWVAAGRANNTRRGRLARACTFLRWCVRQGRPTRRWWRELQSRDNPPRAVPPLYGKVQEGSDGVIPGPYDVEEILRRRVGRPPFGSSAASVESGSRFRRAPGGTGGGAGEPPAG